MYWGDESDDTALQTHASKKGQTLYHSHTKALLNTKSCQADGEETICLAEIGIQGQ